MKVRIRLAAISAALGVIVLALASLQAPALGASTPKFLTLPFTSTAKMHIQRGWWTIGATGQFNLLHHAIDYIKGTQDVTVSWQNFPVAAAAAGEACAAKLGQTGCYDSPNEIMGNRVLIKHDIDGVIYYTFYNHLKSIDPSIPLNNSNNTIHVKQGQVIGIAGASGNDPTFIHLHFELQDAHHKWIDPYGLYGTSRQYPDPAGKKNDLLSATKNYWTTNPPTIFGATPKPTPSPPGSPKPTASASASPGETPTETVIPGESVVPATIGPSAPASVAGGSPGSAEPTPSASPVAVVAPVNPAEGGMGPVPAAIGIGAVVAAAVLLGLLLVSRRRKQPLARDPNRPP